MALTVPLRSAAISKYSGMFAQVGPLIGMLTPLPLPPGRLLWQRVIGALGMCALFEHWLPT